ncbi:MAG: hypothetical protein QUV05_08150 [Phycisphaerae bacterium]|nr:hypothetical protein [Phycisphaerae bacterium]
MTEKKREEAKNEGIGRVVGLLAWQPAEYVIEFADELERRLSPQLESPRLRVIQEHVPTAGRAGHGPGQMTEGTR